jgi:hypothetical protein
LETLLVAREIRMTEIKISINDQDVVSEIIDEEAILINMVTGSYYSLESSACDVWKLLQKGSTDVDTLVQYFDGDSTKIRAELQSFLDELCNENLTQRIEPVTSNVPSACGKLTFSVLTLNKYTDMENLLLMDPIHDVSEQGWPSRQSHKE